MTVNTQYFTNWQDGRQPNSAMFGTTSPALKAVRDHLLKVWGGTDLGGYGTRKVRGGNEWSSHAFGAAIDWRWCSADDNQVVAAQRRKVLDDQILPFLINNSLELGIQAIHDYYGAVPGTGRVWRATRTNGVKGWVNQPDSPTGMGQLWAKWLHIEVYEAAWSNGEPVENKLAPSPLPPAPSPTPAPAVAVPAPTQKIGSKGPEVLKLQQHLAFWQWAKKPFKQDGEFGAITEIAVKQMQRALNVPIDGVYGPKTAGALRTFLVNMSNVAGQKG